jgi:hypothetical protein
MEVAIYFNLFLGSTFGYLIKRLPINREEIASPLGAKFTLRELKKKHRVYEE